MSAVTAFTRWVKAMNRPSPTPPSAETISTGPYSRCGSATQAIAPVTRMVASIAPVRWTTSSSVMYRSVGRGPAYAGWSYIPCRSAAEGTFRPPPDARPNWLITGLGTVAYLLVVRAPTVRALW